MLLSANVKDAGQVSGVCIPTVCISPAPTGLRSIFWMWDLQPHSLLFDCVLDHSPSLHQAHYENLCMKAVNQSIGRAIRHKGLLSCSVHLICIVWFFSRSVVLLFFC